MELELRDIFAGISLHAMLSNPITTESLSSLFGSDDLETQISKAVYKMADEMLKQRDK